MGAHGAHGIAGAHRSHQVVVAYEVSAGGVARARGVVGRCSHSWSRAPPLPIGDARAQSVGAGCPCRPYAVLLRICGRGFCACTAGHHSVGFWPLQYSVCCRPPNGTDLEALTRQMTVSKSSLDAASRYLASKKTMVVSKRQELADQKELLDSTTAYKTKLEAACSEKETSYKEMSALRKNEISALSKSISLLSAQTSGTTTGIKLLRLRVAPSSVDTAGGEEKVSC